jgi:hypothetical protein
MSFKLAILLWIGALTGSQTLEAKSFEDYGGFGKYKQSLADGGGCISGTIGTSIPGKNFNAIVYFAGKQYGEKAKFNKAYFGFSTFDKKHDIDDGKLRASAFQLCLIPGEYEIIGIELRGMESTQEVRMPFTVVAGKNAYLGSLVFHSDAVKAISCGSINSQGVEIRDEFPRDTPLILRLKAAIAPEINILDATLGRPYFYRCPQ